ncbi:MAG: PEGA domain-containing protein [Pseudomonadota bacterium]
MRVLAIVGLVALLGTGCATRIMVPYKVTSAPSGAPVEVNGVHKGDTPTEIQLGTSKRWVGVCVAPGGWAYGNETYSVTAYPPAGSTGPLRSQTKMVRPQETLQGGALFFDLRLESVMPTQPIEIRER